MRLGIAKVGEFGLSQLASDFAMFAPAISVAGLSRWMSPELVDIASRDGKSRPTTASDIWALGCTLFEAYIPGRRFFVSSGALAFDQSSTAGQRRMLYIQPTSARSSGKSPALSTSSTNSMRSFTGRAISSRSTSTVRFPEPGEPFCLRNIRQGMNEHSRLYLAQAIQPRDGLYSSGPRAALGKSYNHETCRPRRVSCVVSVPKRFSTTD
ncbi:Protein kinase of the Mitotic Exit Network [Sarracenia purpurea var. burkii]